MASESTSNHLALQALWAESERKLYPLATTSSTKYQQVVLLARQVANQLTEAVTVDQLGELWPRQEEILREASAQSGLPLADLPATDVAGVGFALRLNEVKAIQHQNQQEAMVSAAREAGEPWVLLHEKGTLEHGVLDPYQAIEMHLGSGAAVVSSVEPNPVDGQANYVLTVIRMDTESGTPIDVDPGIAEVREYNDPDEFASALEALRDFIETTAAD